MNSFNYYCFPTTFIQISKLITSTSKNNEQNFQLCIKNHPRSLIMQINLMVNKLINELKTDELKLLKEINKMPL